MCVSLNSFSYACGEGAIAGGVKELFLITVADLDDNDGSFSTITEGEVSLKIETGKSFAKIGLVKENGLTVSEELAISGAGIKTVTQTLNLAIKGSGKNARTLVGSLVGQPVVAVVKSNQGDSIVYGLDGRLEVSTATSTLDDDNNSFAVVLSGRNADLAKAASSALIALL